MCDYLLISILFSKMKSTYFICLLFAYLTSGIEIFEISKTAQFIFQEQGNMSIPEDTTKIRLSLVLDKIYQEVEDLRIEVNKTSHLCSNYSGDTYCMNTLKQLEMEMKDTYEIRKELGYLSGPTREKRSLLEVCMFQLTFNISPDFTIEAINNTIKIQQEYINNTVRALNKRFETIEKYIIQTNTLNYLQTLLLSVTRYNNLLTNL